ncbi:MAG TPA: hypothetical protein VGO80_22765 [Solirubrobacteraceae bacterium]|jgi:dipeptidyl aminopeptidase/acylaminoacyl peptidase|nr:hypothetical protein [Solirubrobacteraceae bacterium]
MRRRHLRLGRRTAKPACDHAVLDGAFDSWPTWSPDGRRIAVNASLDPDDIFEYPDHHLAEVATRHARRLTRSALLDAHPTWAGSRLLCARVYDELGGGHRTPCERHPSDRVATRHDRLVRHMPGPILEFDASPDGRRVLVADGHARNPGLWVVTVAGSRRRKVQGGQAVCAGQPPDRARRHGPRRARQGPRAQALAAAVRTPRLAAGRPRASPAPPITARTSRSGRWVRTSCSSIRRPAPAHR